MLTSNISDKPMVNIPQESISLEISDKETITNIKSDDINLNSMKFLKLEVKMAERPPIML